MVERNTMPKKPNGKENEESGSKSKRYDCDVKREES